MSAATFSFDKALIIDDTKIDRYTTAFIIKKFGFANEIIEFEMAGKAIAFLEENKEDLQQQHFVILLDISMPEMDGFQFLEKASDVLRSFKSNCNVIIFSSSIDVADRIRAQQNTFVKKFINKPLNVAKLEEIKKIVAPSTGTV